MFVVVTLLLRKNVISKLLQQRSDNSYNIVTCIKITANIAYCMIVIPCSITTLAITISSYNNNN